MDTLKNLNSNGTLTEVAEGDTSPRHETEFKEFIGWIALPIKERQPETQKELAEQFGLSEWTLSQWKKRDGFWMEVNDVRKEWGKGKTPEVMNGLYERAKTGDPAAARLWLEVVENHTTRSKTDINSVNKYTIGLKEYLDEIQGGANISIGPKPENAFPVTGDYLIK